MSKHTQPETLTQPQSETLTQSILNYLVNEIEILTQEEIALLKNRPLCELSSDEIKKYHFLLRRSSVLNFELFTQLKTKKYFKKENYKNMMVRVFEHTLEIGYHPAVDLMANAIKNDITNEAVSIKLEEIAKKTFPKTSLTPPPNEVKQLSYTALAYLLDSDESCQDDITQNRQPAFDNFYNAAISGDAMSQYIIAAYYQKYYTNQKKNSSALLTAMFYWLKLAAKQEFAQALYWLGEFHGHDSILQPAGLKKNVAYALDCYLRAAGKGHHNVGWSIYTLIGIDQEFKKDIEEKSLIFAQFLKNSKEDLTNPHLINAYLKSSLEKIPQFSDSNSAAFFHHSHYVKQINQTTPKTKALLEKFKHPLTEATLALMNKDYDAFISTLVTPSGRSIWEDFIKYDLPIYFFSKESIIELQTLLTKLRGELEFSASFSLSVATGISNFIKERYSVITPLLLEKEFLFLQFFIGWSLSFFIKCTGELDKNIFDICFTCLMSSAGEGYRDSYQLLKTISTSTVPSALPASSHPQLPVYALYSLALIEKSPSLFFNLLSREKVPLKALNFPFKDSFEKHFFTNAGFPHFIELLDKLINNLGKNSPFDELKLNSIFICLLISLDIFYKKTLVSNSKENFYQYINHCTFKLIKSIKPECCPADDYSSLTNIYIDFCYTLLLECDRKKIHLVIEELFYFYRLANLKNIPLEITQKKQLAILLFQELGLNIELIFQETDLTNTELDTLFLVREVAFDFYKPSNRKFTQENFFDLYNIISSIKHSSLSKKTISQPPNVSNPPTYNEYFNIDFALGIRNNLLNKKLEKLTDNEQTSFCKANLYILKHYENKYKAALEKEAILDSINFLINATEINASAINSFPEYQPKDKITFVDMEDILLKEPQIERGKSYFCYGFFLSFGIATGKDHAMATKYFEKSSKEGYSLSAFFIARDKLRSENQSIKDTGLVTLKGLANNNLTPAQFALGNYFYDVNEYDQALTYLLPLAKTGHHTAQETVASIYYKKRFKEKFILWATLAAKQGNISAQVKLSDFYVIGFRHGLSFKKPESDYWLKVSFFLSKLNSRENKFTPEIDYRLKNNNVQISQESVNAFVKKDFALFFNSLGREKAPLFFYKFISNFILPAELEEFIVAFSGEIKNSHTQEQVEKNHSVVFYILQLFLYWNQHPDEWFSFKKIITTSFIKILIQNNRKWLFPNFKNISPITELLINCADSNDSCGTKTIGEFIFKRWAMINLAVSKKTFKYSSMTDLIDSSVLKKIIHFFFRDYLNNPHCTITQVEKIECAHLTLLFHIVRSAHLPITEPETRSKMIDDFNRLFHHINPALSNVDVIQYSDPFKRPTTLKRKTPETSANIRDAHSLFKFNPKKRRLNPPETPSSNDGELFDQAAPSSQ